MSTIKLTIQHSGGLACGYNVNNYNNEEGVTTIMPSTHMQRLRQLNSMDVELLKVSTSLHNALVSIPKLKGNFIRELEETKDEIKHAKRMKYLNKIRDNYTQILAEVQKHKDYLQSNEVRG